MSSFPFPYETDIVDDKRTTRRSTSEPHGQRLQTGVSGIHKGIGTSLVGERQQISIRAIVHQLLFIEADLQTALQPRLAAIDGSLRVEGECVVDVFAERGDGLTDIGGSVPAARAVLHLERTANMVVMMCSGGRGYCSIETHA